MEQTKRRKPKPKMAPVRNLKEANQALSQIARHVNDLKRIEADSDDKIAEIKAAADKQVQPINEEIKALEAGLSAYSEMNREELFSDKKTQEVLFGFFGFRKSTKISLSRNHTLDLLKKFGLHEAIKIKETPDKKKMADYPDDLLEKVEAKRLIEDIFWYEIKQEKLEEL